MTICVSDLHENIKNQGYWQKHIWVINCCRTQQQLEAYFNLFSIITCDTILSACWEDVNHVAYTKNISSDLKIQAHTYLAVIFDERLYLAAR